MTQTQTGSRQALVRQKQMRDPQNCLSCGDSEVNLVKYDFIPKLNESGPISGRQETGWHYRDHYMKTHQGPIQFRHSKRPTTAAHQIALNRRSAKAVRNQQPTFTFEEQVSPQIVSHRERNNTLIEQNEDDQTPDGQLPVERLVL